MTTKGADILVVDDQKSSRDLVRLILQKQGHRVHESENGDQALDMVKEKKFGTIICDLHMPGMTGGELLPELKKRIPDAPVIIFTAYGSIESAVEMVRSGAYDYITKPFESDDLIIKVQNALEKEELKAQIKELREARDENKLIGISKALQEIKSKIDTVAETDVPVLITGESGTGKELVARDIHRKSERRKGLFITADCGAIPESLIENELFGHVKGAYTHAYEDRKGLFESADGGTFFLDEIGELTPPNQVKLLRVLQEKEFKRVGDTRTIKLDSRFIFATNRDLPEAMKNGDFRQDLYYRINVFSIEVPPLRLRKEDILPLASFFLKKAQADINLDATLRNFTKEAIDRLLNYNWPGNVRELENRIMRACVASKGDSVKASDLNLNGTGSEDNRADEKRTFDRAKMDFEKKYLTRLLSRNNGNISRSAREAGRYRADLYKLIKKHGIDVDSFRN